MTTAARGAIAGASRSGWLRSRSFDLTLIVGVLALALALGALASVSRALFSAVLLFDLWIFAYPHVASMYTRVAFDRKSVAANRFLLFVLPPLVLAATASVTALGGVVALNSLYFYWQSHHYTKQSYGIARAYRRALGLAPRDVVSDWVVFSFPVWGVLHRANQRPPTFYDAPLWSPPVPHALVVLAGAVALASLVVFTARLVLRPAGDELAPGHALFVLSHVVITVVSYVAIADVTRGWLLINVWHNAQYLLFVWAANARKFERGVDAEQPIVSRLSQPGQVLAYAAVCLALSTVFYLTLGRLTAALTLGALPVVLIAHQTINFHHYLVDAVIWKAPRRARAGARAMLAIARREA